MNLTEQELRGLIKVTKKSKTTLYGICPRCKKNEFGISLKEPHLFGCFRKKKCGFAGNIYTLYKHFQIPIKNGLKLKFEGLSMEPIDLGIKEEHDHTILPEIKMPIGFRITYSDPYLIERGYTQEDFNNYVCGHTKIDLKFKNRIIIGFKERGKIIAYTARTLIDELPKYRNSEGKAFERYIDGLNESNYTEATLVEGHFDRINIRNKFNNIGIKSRVVTCNGAKISPYQLEKLEQEGITTLNLFFDPDVWSIIEKTLSRLEHKFNVNVMLIEDFNKDPGDLTEKEVTYYYKNKVNFINFTTRLPLIQL